MQIVLIMAMLMTGDSELAAGPVDSVPSQFTGVWSPDLKDCDSGDNDGIVVLRSRYIAHWESEGAIRAIVMRGEHEIALINELGGEGDKRLTTERYVLSDTQDRLFARNIPGRQLILYRCPGTGPQPGSSP